MFKKAVLIFSCLLLFSPPIAAEAKKGKRLNSSSHVGKKKSRSKGIKRFRKRGPYSRSLALGLMYASPTLIFQQALGNFSVGGQASLLLYPTESGTLKGPGIYATANYYPSGKTFLGPWIQLGLGLVDLNYEDPTESASFTGALALSAMGWRFEWAKRMSVGLGVGAQLFINDLPQTTASLPTVLPYFNIDAGIRF